MYEFQAVRLIGTQAERCIESRLRGNVNESYAFQPMQKKRFPIPRIRGYMPDLGDSPSTWRDFHRFENRTWTNGTPADRRESITYRTEKETRPYTAHVHNERLRCRQSILSATIRSPLPVCRESALWNDAIRGRGLVSGNVRLAKSGNPPRSASPVLS